MLWLASGGAALLFLLASDGAKPVIPNPVPDIGSARDLVVHRALLEHGRVNALPAGVNADPADYWSVAAPSVRLSPAELKATDWCGGFYLWALKVTGLAPDIDWRFDGTGLRAGGGNFPPTRDPKPGDLAYFHRNQHHALVESVDGDDIHIINGNGGGKGITRSTVSRSQVAGFFSIEPLLARAGVA